MIRGPVVTRKNAGAHNEDSTRLAAVIWTITATIQMASLNPLTYLTAYLDEQGIRVKYIHHNIDTMERMELLRDLRQGVFDVLVGINLLREGIDLPEVTLVAVLDADKEGMLRSETALVQIIGRATRDAPGKTRSRSKSS